MRHCTLCLKIGLKFIRIIFINFSCCFSPINSIRSHKIGPVHLDQSLETSKVGYSALFLAKKLKTFFSNSGRASAIFFIRVYLLHYAFPKLGYYIKSNIFEPGLEITSSEDFSFEYEVYNIHYLWRNQASFIYQN